MRASSARDVRVLAAEDLVLEDVDHAAEIAELGEQRRQLVHHRDIGRAKDRGASSDRRRRRPWIAELLAPQLDAPR